LFERNVFINCPFDPEYRPLLSSILFCVVRAGLEPRLATENADSGNNRLERICQLMRQSRYSVHDLSRCQAIRRGEIARLNMPFELGLDYGYRTCGDPQLATKRFLVLDEKPFRLKQALSDINGWDPVAHEGVASVALNAARDWLVQVAKALLPGGEVTYGESLIFEEWKYGQPDHARSDVDRYSSNEMVAALKQWNSLGRPEDPAIR
jgi:hypothetical protein